MNPCALWRWIGSELPGGYSTVTISPSLPGHPVRSFDSSSVTVASCAIAALDRRHAAATITFVKLMDYSRCDHRVAAVATHAMSGFVRWTARARFRSASPRGVHYRLEPGFSR